MAELTTEKMMYLLYATAYTEAGSVTKGAVRSRLPNEWKGKTEKIYDSLQQQKLIRLVSKGRFSVTELGEKTLVENLTTTSYKFHSAKGSKVLNALLSCVGKAAEAHTQIASKKMAFNQFQSEFKSLYFNERRRQSLEGVIAICKREISKQFIEQNSISQEQFDQYFERLKTEGEITVIEGSEDKLIEWIE